MTTPKRPADVAQKNGKKKRRGGKEVEEFDDELMKALKQSLGSEVETKDSLQLYTDNLRETLRQIHDPRVLLLVQNDIDQTVCRARMGLFNAQMAIPGNVQGFNGWECTPFTEHTN